MKLLSALETIVKALNETPICWAVGGSFLLQQSGLPAEPNDLDLLVADKDAATSHKFLSQLGSFKQGQPVAPFCTRHFYTYTIHGVQVDVISGFQIEHEEGIFSLPFDIQSISGKRQLYSGIEIPLSALEDWFVLYSLMPSPNKQAKAKQIKQHLLVNPTEHPELLRRLLQLSLPQTVIQDIQMILSNCQNLDKM
jgi:hypothetical protein